ncbi:MAG: AEC family transporter [Alphaproteobacteria bacterium]|nr:AEC family transporter [Alphaproteobacteria bacterium]
MPGVVGTLLPIFLMIGAGWLARRSRFPGEAFWPALDRVVYFALFPALLIRTFANAKLGGLEIVAMAATIWLTMAAMVVGLLLARPLLNVAGPTFASLLQTAVRFNAYTGLAVSQAAYGETGLALFSLAIALVTPLANVISVTAFLRLAEATDGRRPRVWRELARNPLILGIAVGLLLNASGAGLPWPLSTIFDLAAPAALPLALLSAGAGLDLGAVRGSGVWVVVGVALRLVGMPLLVLAMAWWFGLEGQARQILLLYACLPTSPAGYTLARQLGGDAPATAGMIALSTLLAMLTMPFWLG